MGRFTRRVLAIVAVTATTALSAVSVAAAGPAAARATTITFTKQTVLVPTTTVQNQLTSVSKNGATYTFKSNVGMLRNLKAGKVMLLQNLAVRDVTTTAMTSGHLVVTTTPAKLTDLVANGSISWSRSLAFTKAFVISGAGVPKTGSLPARFGMRPLASGVTLTDSTHSYNYSVKFTPSASGLAAAITITRPTGVKITADITGKLPNLKTSGHFTVDHGSFSNAKLLVGNLNGQFKLTYTAKSVTEENLGSDGGIKIALPAEIAIPFFVGSVPLYLGVRTAFFASADFSDLNQKVSGTWTLGSTGQGGYGLMSSGAMTRAGNLKASGGIVLNSTNRVRTGPVSFVFGAQLPQLELGLGVKGLDVAGNVTVVGSTGVSAFSGECDTRQIEVIGSGGAQASFFGLSTDGSQALFDKKTQAAFPAQCGNFP